MSLNLIISGGGTGGHIYPAISIANQLTKKINNCDILFVGAKSKMEMIKVPENGYKIIPVNPPDINVETKPIENNIAGFN